MNTQIPNTKKKKKDIVRNTPDPEKQALANSISFNLPEINSTIGPVVYDLRYGNKYIIHGGLTLGGSLFHIQKAYGYFYAYEHQPDQKMNSHFFGFFSHIKRHPGLSFQVVIHFVSENPYCILKFEQMALDRAIGDTNNLNTNMIAYIPKYNPKTKQYGWMNKGHVLNFKKYLKNR